MSEEEKEKFNEKYFLKMNYSINLDNHLDPFLLWGEGTGRTCHGKFKNTSSYYHSFSEQLGISELFGAIFFIFNTPPKTSHPALFVFTIVFIYLRYCFRTLNYAVIQPK